VPVRLQHDHDDVPSANDHHIRTGDHLDDRYPDHDYFDDPSTDYFDDGSAAYDYLDDPSGNHYHNRAGDHFDDRHLDYDHREWRGGECAGAFDNDDGGHGGRSGVDQAAGIRIGRRSACTATS
jgi:hypothetical protein